jgi:hypothetical protein
LESFPSAGSDFNGQYVKRLFENILCYSDWAKTVAQLKLKTMKTRNSRLFYSFIYFCQTKRVFYLSVPFLKVQKAPHKLYLKEVMLDIILLSSYSQVQ